MIATDEPTGAEIEARADYLMASRTSIQAAADLFVLDVRGKYRALAREQLLSERQAAAKATIKGKVVRRKRGRPGWNDTTFHAAYREARDRAGGPTASDKEIAAEMAISLDWFQTLVQRHGRPE